MSQVELPGLLQAIRIVHMLGSKSVASQSGCPRVITSRSSSATSVTTMPEMSEVWARECVVVVELAARHSP
nr:hypothetical protein CFP56_10466 [Quercus suber]